MADLSDILGVGGSGSRLLDRQVFLSSGTWTAPAVGAGNVSSGVGRTLRIIAHGAGGGSASGGTGSGPGQPGGDSFVGQYRAYGGPGGALLSSVRGGYGLTHDGTPGTSNVVANGYPFTPTVPSTRGSGGTPPSGNFGGPAGGISIFTLFVDDLGPSASVTIGSGGAIGPGTVPGGVGQPGYLIVETWG